MKKIIYISAIVLGLGVVSCQKQDFTPAPEEMEIPAWEDEASMDENARGTSTTNARGGSDDEGDPTSSDDGSGANEDGEITDPNVDPDAD